MSAGPSRSGLAAVSPRTRAPALIAGLVLALVPVTAGDAASGSTGETRATAGSGSPALGSVVKRCRTVRVKLRRNGKVVTRDGRPVFRRVRRCKLVPSPGCRFVRVKKRKNGKVVKRTGKPVYIKVERCPPKTAPIPVPGPTPSPGPGPTPEPGPGPAPSPGPGPGPGPGPPGPEELANRALALGQHVPGNIDLFTSEFPNGADGLYPSGSAMAPASGTPPTEDEVRAQLTTYLNRWFNGDTAKIDAALALFDDDDLEALMPDPTLRAAFACMKGTVLEPAIDYLLTSGKFTSIQWGSIPNQALIANSTGGSTNRLVIFNNRYTAERFEYLIGIMGHEFLHDDSSTPRAEEAILNALSAMTYMQVLSKTPELAHGGTELARQMNDLALLFVNSREAGSPNSEIYAPTGLGVAPGSPYDAPDFWTVLNGGGSSPASEPLRTILQNAFSPGTSIPATLNYDQATAELFENLNDAWLTDVQRAQISVLVQLVTVDDIAQATGLTEQQIIDTLGLQPYLDAIE